VFDVTSTLGTALVVAVAGTCDAEGLKTAIAVEHEQVSCALTLKHSLDYCLAHSLPPSLPPSIRHSPSSISHTHFISLTYQHSRTHARSLHPLTHPLTHSPTTKPPLTHH